MKKYIYLLLLSFSILLSCNENNSKLPLHKLTVELSINRFSDSTFFSDIRSLYYHDGKFFATDNVRDNIFLLNSQLELEITLGNTGRGPGELLGASDLFLYHDSIFVLNDYNRTFEIFNRDGHLKTIRLPHQIVGLHSGYRFCVKNGKIILSNPNVSTSISKFSYTSDSIFCFGNLKVFRTEKETQVKNNRHLQMIEEEIIALPDCHPNIEIYNQSGELLVNYEFRNIDLINELLQFTENQNSAPNSYYRLFQDLYVYNNQIFILTLSLNKNGRIQCNKIIQFEMTKNNIIPKKIFDLGDGWFGPFCVTGEKILAFNSRTAELILYNYE